MALRIELDGPHHPLREAAEVAAEVGQEVDARADQERAALRSHFLHLRAMGRLGLPAEIDMG